MSNVPLDAVVLEGSVLVYLPKSIVIQTVHLCGLSWIYLESNLSSHAHFRHLPKTEQLKQKTTSMIANGFHSVEDRRYIAQKGLWALWQLLQSAA